MFVMSHLGIAVALHELLDEVSLDVGSSFSVVVGCGSSGSFSVGGGRAGSGGGGKLSGLGNIEKSRPSGSFPSMTGNVIWQAASRTVFSALFATSKTAPTRPFPFGFGSGLHLSDGSSILTNGISGRFGFLIRNTGNKSRSVTSGMSTSVRTKRPSSLNSVGRMQSTSDSEIQKTLPSGLVSGFGVDDEVGVAVQLQKDESKSLKAGPVVVKVGAREGNIPVMLELTEDTNDKVELVDDALPLLPLLLAKLVIVEEP